MTADRNGKVESGFNRYFLLFDLGAATFAIWLVALVLTGASGWVSGLQLGWLFLLLVLFSRKRRDEFAQHCWSKAAQAAFAALIVSPLLAGFVTGLMDGFAGRQHDAGWTIDALFAAVFAVFFATFEWTRFWDGAE